MSIFNENDTIITSPILEKHVSTFFLIPIKKVEKECVGHYSYFHLFLYDIIIYNEYWLYLVKLEIVTIHC